MAGSSRRRRPAGSWTSWPASCSGRGAASTPSARPGTRATRWSRWPCGRPIRPCCTTGRAAFYVARAQQVPGSTPVRDVLQGLMALADEPIAGGRHKVFGHPDLAIIPQTSTIASHLPRAVGLAIALHRAHRLGRGLRVAGRRRRGVLLRRRLGQPLHRGRGDQHRAQRRLPRAAGPDPVRLRGQRSGASRCRPRRAGSRPRTAPGRVWPTSPPTAPIPARAWPVIARGRAHAYASERRPVFLHLRTVRFLGHAGSDVEISYRTPREIEADYARDPLLATARALRRGRVPSRTRCSPGTTPSGPRSTRGRRGWPEQSTARLGGRGDGAARAAPAGPGRRGRRGALRRARRSGASRAPSPSRSTRRWPIC